jgi:N-acetyl-anhydromuramyl-L-alanine amidase AmpD
MILGQWDGPQLGPGGSVHPGDIDIIKSASLTGFQLFNLGDDVGQRIDLATKDPRRLARMSAMLVDRYTEVQLRVVDELCGLLVAAYGITQILGHEEIAPGRKIDPGPAFPLDEMRRRLLPSPVAASAPATQGATGSGDAG